MVLPQGFVWQATADLGNIPDGDRADVCGALMSLFEAGLLNVGKSKARAHVSSKTGGLESVEASSRQDDLWIITLQTHALLLDPRRLNEETSEAGLHAAYESSWNDIFNGGGSLSLKRYFARQWLAGGYLFHRFLRKAGDPCGTGPVPYNPYILTEPGSVFVFEASTDPTKLLSDWLKHGLPLPSAVKEVYGSYWNINPFIPANGYGEITVNHDWHEKLCPEEGDFKYVREPAVRRKEVDP